MEYKPAPSIPLFLPLSHTSETKIIIKLKINLTIKYIPWIFLNDY